MPNNETWEEKLEKILPLIVEDYNNFITEADEIGEMDIEEIWSDRIKPLFLESLTLARREERESIKKAVISIIESSTKDNLGVLTALADIVDEVTSPTSITRNEETQ